MIPCDKHIKSKKQYVKSTLYVPQALLCKIISNKRALSKTYNAPKKAHFILHMVVHFLI